MRDLGAENSMLKGLVRKLAPAVFLESEGGGHDLGLWLDCGELNEVEYELIVHALAAVQWNDPVWRKKAHDDLLKTIQP